MTEEQLDELLTQPRRELVEFISRIRGPLVILGAGGKMGPTLAVLARRAAAVAGHDLRIVAVSRFGKPAAREWLERQGVETVSCDLFDRTQVMSLPDAANVIYLVGQKFGTERDPASTWAVNTIPPGHVAERYSGARIAALSTGNVYPMLPHAGGGATEDTPLQPLGEYPNAAVARERLFEFHCRRHATPLVLIRLNYAVELRYGVLHDLAGLVWRNEPVPLANGWFNCIWQGDANERILRLLDHAASPHAVFNLSGPTLSVRDCALRLGQLLDRRVSFVGEETETSLLSNSGKCDAVLGPPAVEIGRVLEWTADWIRTGGRSFQKPTGFEVRNGRF